MADAATKVYQEMLDRLYAAVTNGPGLNCRPHNSRQRIDFSVLAALAGAVPEALLAQLLRQEKVRLAIKPLVVEPVPEGVELSAEERSARKRAEDQVRTINKLRVITDDAKTFEQDTGAHVLYVGFPILHMPGGLPGTSQATKKIIAPITLIPISVSVTRGRQYIIELESAGAGADLVIPNPGLISWIEQQTGKKAEEVFSDEEGKDPYREINELMDHVRKALTLPDVAALTSETSILPIPRPDDDKSSEPQIISSAVLGIFPLSNQSLIHDTEALVDGERPTGPVEQFVKLEKELASVAAAENQIKRKRVMSEERFVSDADPCQARAVRSARNSEILAVHGPPGTGKSQTIANMIGDHLARGERVLLVCDKRTAIDVVWYRLQRIGLGDLCAVIHDAQADQRDLYMSVREQLENLPETKVDPGVEARLLAIDTELQKLHDELSKFADALFDRPNGKEDSFHELMGMWIECNGRVKVTDDALKTVRLADADAHERDMREILQRGIEGKFIDNPWADRKVTGADGAVDLESGAAGIELKDYLKKNVDDWSEILTALVAVAEKLDATADSYIPPFPEVGDASAIGHSRTAFGAELDILLKRPGISRLAGWGKRDARALASAKEELNAHATYIELLKQGKLELELLQVHKATPITSAQIAPWIGTLDAYLEVCDKWYAFLAFSKKSQAGVVLKQFGLTLSGDNAKRVRTFLIGLRARLTLNELIASTLGSAPLPNAVDDVAMLEALDDYAACFDLLEKAGKEPAVSPLMNATKAAISDPANAAAFLDGLKRSEARGAAISKLESEFLKSELFAPEWLGRISKHIRQGASVAPVVRHLSAHITGLESIIRMRYCLEQIPSGMKDAARKLLEQSATPDEGWLAVRRTVINAEINRRVQQHPHLFVSDGKALGARFDRYRELDLAKRGIVREYVRQRWTQVQRNRLLAATGNRLNSDGADLRRRTVTQGRNKMRLRQTIKMGQQNSGGDPLFDLRPVWMASPGTVAQIFPRKQLFDLVIFDEASQCRLEEAIPVLLRGKRVVVAGDPKQLPPTRFFESAMTRSEDESAETDEEVFVEQTLGSDDLLSAVLEKAVENSYLDVHYRSRNSDLIEFSNQNFYNSRLQAIPGHPSSKPISEPVRVHAVAGVYEKGVNKTEATYVVKLVRNLLKRSEPPSIGIACFNISQRDTIVDALDEAATNDEEFAARLAQARNRQGAGSFEGLFVKNLENVQGDERDYMLISTVYGPDKVGRFYRRFGPLLTAGGGRRLNVLITRAREEVHLITSIPPEAYRALAPVPEGTQPNGGWLLLAYLKFAEELDRGYELQRQLAKERKASADGIVTVRPIKNPSRFSKSLAEQLARSNKYSSTVHWGNEGFCVDIAIHHPDRADDVTLGICCDVARYDKAEDLVEWEVFRTMVLESQGWKLHRIWTPQFARDISGSMTSIQDGVNAILAGEKAADAEIDDALKIQ